MHAVLERGEVTCTLAEDLWQRLRLANNFAFALLPRREIAPADDISRPALGRQVSGAL